MRVKPVAQPTKPRIRQVNVTTHMRHSSNPGSTSECKLRPKIHYEIR